MQAQVGDIGLMGAPAKVDGKAVEGVKIMLGGKIGENPEVRAVCMRGRGGNSGARLAIWIPRQRSAATGALR